MMKETAKKRREKKVATQKIVFLLATVFMITIGSVIFGNSFSAAQSDENVTLYKYYKSIELEEGDSLWSIAETYKLKGTDTRKYVVELMKINNLTSDKINSNKHLIIMYYDTEFR